MRKSLFSILISIVVFYTFTNNSDNVSNGNGWNTCGGGGSCHSASSATTVDSIRLIHPVSGATMSGYYPDSSYTLKIMGHNTSGTATYPGFGFIARVVNGSSAVVGSYTSTQTSTGTISSGTMWTHSAVLSPTGSNYVATAVWKAPTGQGTLSLQGIINAVNTASGSSGDAVSSVGSFSIPVFGTISSITCGSSTSAGTLTNGIAASGVTLSIPYTGGNGGPHSGQIVTSTGVSGLTATLSAGNFATGAGNLSFTITGTPTSAGTASFAINIGTKSCTHTVSVGLAPGTVTSLLCDSGKTTGILNSGSSASGVSFKIPYTGGNGGVDSADNSSSTSITGLTATHSAAVFKNGDSFVTYTVSGTPSGEGRAYFSLKIGGKTCTYNDTVYPPIGTITSLTCGSGSTSGTVYSGVTPTGVTFTIPYNGGNNGTHNGQTVGSTGVTGLVATLASGRFNTGGGSVTYTLSGNASGTGTASFALNIGGQPCTYNVSVVAPDGTIDSLVCAMGSSSGVLSSGIAATGVQFTIPYLNGNSKVYPIGSFSSTGVTGLTANLASGTFASGNGNLVFNVSGTPASAGTASFSLSVAGKSCTYTMQAYIPNGTISSLGCDSGRSTSKVYIGASSSGISLRIPYKGGNGGVYPGDTVQSTGITGYTATLVPGSFAMGDDTLTYVLSGSSSTSGVANFTLNVRGKSCTFPLDILIPIGSVNGLRCDSVIYTGPTLQYLSSVTGVTLALPYNGGNGGTHTGQTVNSTGVTGITATASPGTFSLGKGSIFYTLSGTLNGYGNASFAFNIGGKSCTYSFYVKPQNASILTLECNLASTASPVFANVSTNGNILRIPYKGGNGGSHSKLILTSSVITGITATLDSSLVKYGDSTLAFKLTGTPSAVGLATFTINIGGRSCNYQLDVQPQTGTISKLNCSSGTASKTLSKGENASGTTVTISYTGSNLGTYPAQTVNSTGVTGLKASLAAGTFSNTSSNLVFSLSGAATTTGKAIFPLSIGGQTCAYELDVITPNASVGGFLCSTGIISGILKENELANGVSFTAPYRNGNGGKFSSMSIASTGVSGLTATISSGNIFSGDGELEFAVTGTPLGDGKAVFKILLEKSSCFIAIPVENTDTISSAISHVATNSAVYKFEDRIFFNNFKSSIEYSIYDINGKQIANSKLNSPENSISLRELNLVSGIYIVKFTTDKVNGSLKFLY